MRECLKLLLSRHHDVSTLTQAMELRRRKPELEVLSSIHKHICWNDHVGLQQSCERVDALRLLNLRDQLLRGDVLGLWRQVHGSHRDTLRLRFLPHPPRSLAAICGGHEEELNRRRVERKLRKGLRS